ncbi:MAG: efflux RND transporter periplasmic adaptor subunit [Polaromonas sp.]|uniref:efflux RND transporter periplasmic adaptor subunit n=1 Tax=Polaromonas sp. TaxID=1869339 RepID=UPI0027350749|nr:efflux RND transporter periplasmic adaptor subunit [Polaromonas sp.]MDP2818859.1 efflux RND transporter periplasmic adaptor subunit [Polaromonas sp.]
MRQSTKLTLGLIVVAVLAAGGGYWAGNRGTGGSHDAVANVGESGNSAKQERKVLYYRNPMGLPDQSPVPKKDPMGMAYLPVYEGEADADPASANQIKISTDKVQKLGVRTEAASMKAINKIVRAAGRIEPDERRIYVISPKFEGYVERLHVSATGQAVGKGQPLFEVYSPELVSAQREYAIAAQGVQSLQGAEGEAQSGMKQLADSALMRLKNWDISEEQVKALAKSGEARRTMTFRSPVSGLVTEKKAVQGMRFMPGEILYQITDLSSVWALADVFEQDLSLVKSGAKAKVKINAYPEKIFEGTIAYVYPTLKAETRTVQVRVELANPGQLLKPGMFAQVELAAPIRKNTVTVPLSAVIDSGVRRIVLVQIKEGRFEPREVKLGARSDDYVEVLDGIRDGELVVVAANFLIDAESNLKAVIGSFGSAAPVGSASPKASEPAAAHPGGGAAAGHKGEGKVDGVDAKAGTVSIAHGPIASLKWPAMTMGFKVANSTLLKDVTPGTAVAFEFVERQPGEWVITGIQPAAAGKASAGAPPAAPPSRQ